MNIFYRKVVKRRWWPVRDIYFGMQFLRNEPVFGTAEAEHLEWFYPPMLIVFGSKVVDQDISHTLVSHKDSSAGKIFWRNIFENILVVCNSCFMHDYFVWGMIIPSPMDWWQKSSAQSKSQPLGWAYFAKLAAPGSFARIYINIDCVYRKYR